MKKLVMVMAVVLMSAMCFAQEIMSYSFDMIYISKGSYPKKPVSFEKFMECPPNWSLITQRDKLVLNMGDKMLMCNIVNESLNKETGVTEYKLYSPVDGQTAYLYYFKNKEANDYIDSKGYNAIALEFDFYAPVEQLTFHLVTFERL